MPEPADIAGPDRDAGAAHQVAVATRLPNWPARMHAPLAAAYIGVSPTRLRLGAKDGKYPAPHQDGRSVLWHRRDLDDWLEQERTGVASYRRDKRSWGERLCESP